MLAVSPLRDTKNYERGDGVEGFSVDENGFLDFSGVSLLDSIDFDDLFVGISDGDSLPGLEVDQELLADFSASCDGGGGGGDESLSISDGVGAGYRQDDKVSASVSTAASDLCSGSSSLVQGAEIVSRREEADAIAAAPPLREAREKTTGRKNSKNPPGNRKVKVDWTPELHRRFVQAVEQLGVDKAVPSRILEIMGINCLTRHNIASHLQKYRSHRKHLLAREAEAASWSQRRQMPAAVAPGGAGKRDVNPWIAPTMGFPRVQPMPTLKPLHVWGHPSVDQSFMHIWPKHLSHSPPPPHAWPPPPPPPTDPSSHWHYHHHNVPAPGTPCFPSHFPSTRFSTAGVPVTPAVYPSPPAGQKLPQPPSHVHPSKESIDAAIEDVLSKPWLPLPLGLKPPSIDSVMSELHRQGI